MDLSEIANEHLKTINLSWDFARDPNHGISDISLDKVNRFIDISNRYRDYPITDDPLTVLKKFELLRDNFKVTLFPIRETKSGGVNGGVSELFDFIRANPGLKTKDIKAAMDLPQRTMERWLGELREQHKIRFQGAPKTGKYYPIE